MHTDSSSILLVLIKAALNKRTNAISPNIDINWSEVRKLAIKNGVTAIAWRGLEALLNDDNLSSNQQPCKGLKLQWALNAEHIEKRYRKQLVLASELAEVYASNDISTIVLKGLAISRYYPIPEHRECGDLDCFLARTNNTEQNNIAVQSCNLPISDYNRGNALAKEIGAQVEMDFYKHSHINYKGLTVENHAFCTAVRGSRDKKEFERHLQTLLSTKPLTPIGNSKLLSPCADFNALFLTVHSFQHFLTEGIKLRHLLDWALLLQAEQDNIDWGSFYKWCDKMHYTKFADALTAIAVEYLGIEITNKAIHTESHLRDKVLDDILYNEQSVNNTKASKLKKRLMIIRNRMFGGWKYRELYEKSAFVDTIQMVIAFFIERKPKL